MKAGGVLSTTVKLVEQVLVLPAASVTVSVTLVVPRPTVVPAAGLCVTVRAPESVQLSETSTLRTKSSTVAWQSVLAKANTSCAGHLMKAGGVGSTTVTVAVELLDVPLQSVTVSVTVCGPAPVKLVGETSLVIASPSG